MEINAKLNKACQTALEDYMGVSQDETLLVVCDEHRRDIGLALFENGKRMAMESIYVEMKSREMNGNEPPDQVASLMRKVDVVLCPTTRSLTHTDARRRASELGVRVGTMPGITQETMERCFSADYQKVMQQTLEVEELMKKCYSIRVTSKIGTDITLNIKKRKVFASTGILRTIGQSGNLPSGEVYVAPNEAKVNGTVVFDGSFAGIGLLKNPITVQIIDGYARSIEGKEEADDLKMMLETGGRHAYAVGEFGIGTNYKAKLCGHILEDEKVLGTIHIAFGNNISMGGKVNVPIHLDGLVKRPTVFFDDVKIMENGKFTY